MSILKKIRSVFQSKRELIVMPFGGYANNERIHTQARVLKDKLITPSEKDSVFKNFLLSYKRLESDEKSGETVNINWGKRDVETISNEEGYIMIDQKHDLNVSFEENWIPVSYHLMAETNELSVAYSEVLKPAADAEYGIISDLDDTVLYTGVSSLFKWRLLVNSLFVHSSKRTPLPGAIKFYTLLRKGKSGKSKNPFFYLSNSPWNLYEYLQDFLSHFEFPKGALLLRDINFSFGGKKHSFIEGNKYKKIKHILGMYPKLQFVLIGDAGEEDTDIYLHIARNYPDQIKSIYIRTVRKKSRTERVRTLIKQYTDIDVMLMTDGKKAIKHARENQLIE